MGDWLPAGKEEQAFKDSISGLQTSINKVVQNVGVTDVPSKFILRSRGYFDLRSYVLSGKDFPKSESEFDKLIPSKAFTDISTFDDKIYALTKKTMVGVGSSCDDYYNNQLARLVNAASAAIQYADNAENLLTVEDGLNLKHHLNIVLDPKYLTPADQDATFRDSREAAQMTLLMLKEDAESKKRDVDDILAKLLTFKTTTMELQPNVVSMKKQYKTGPVENNAPDAAKKRPYLDQLSAKYNEKVEDLKNKLVEAQAKDDAWEKTTAGAIAFAFCPGLGWIAMSVLAAKAASLKEAYNSLMKTIRQGQEENAEALRVSQNVSIIIEQCNQIEGKMETAIKAMSELSELFAHHATCYDKISLYLNMISMGVKSDSGNNRKTFVGKGLDKCVEWLKELRNTAKEFQKDIVREEKLTT